MTPFSIRRSVSISDEDGQRPGELVIELIDHSPHAECRWAVSGFDLLRSRSYGDDVLQALCLGLRSLWQELEDWKSHGVVISWNAPGDNCGISTLYDSPPDD